VPPLEKGRKIVMVRSIKLRKEGGTGSGVWIIEGLQDGDDSVKGCQRRLESYKGHRLKGTSVFVVLDLLHTKGLA
jgi:hypothetical protein